jgi:hypothetical protein
MGYIEIWVGATDDKWLADPIRTRPRQFRACGEVREICAGPEVARPRSIASPARPSSDSGTVRPGALAVLRLMISADSRPLTVRTSNRNIPQKGQAEMEMPGMEMPMGKPGTKAGHNGLH